MNGVTGFLVLLGGLGVLWLLLTYGSPAASTDDVPDEVVDGEIKADRETLATALDACQTAHPEVADALSWLAAQDGTVSKQELRIIFQFCEAQGTAINERAYTALARLNSGVSMKVGITEAEALQSIAALASKPVAYRLAFYGAANRLCGSQKNISQAKQRFLKQAEQVAGGG